MIGGFKRQDRVADIISRSLAKLLLEMRDPRISIVTISDVVLSSDYSIAKVYFSLLHDQEKDEVAKVLNKASGFLRTGLAKTLNMRSTPALRFIYDDTEFKASKIDRLLSRALSGQAK